MKKWLKGMIIGMGAVSLGIMTQSCQPSQAATSDLPKIVGQEKVIYLDGKNNISVEGKYITSVRFSSSKKNVAVVSRKGTVKPRKKGKSVIRAKVTYRKKKGGKRYTKTLKYKVKVQGKSSEYFKKNKKNPVIYHLTSKGKKQKELYIPSYVSGKKITGFKASLADAKVKTLHVPDTVRGIGDALENCKTLEKIYIGKKLQSIGSLLGCISLKSAVVASGNIYMEEKDGIIFNKSNKCLLNYLPGKPESTYQIPDGIIVVGERAFVSATHLNEISFCDSVWEIENNAFEDTAMSKIILPDTIEYIGSEAFKGCRQLTSIRLSKRIYKLPWKFLSGCDNLREIEVPSGVEKISEEAFAQCKNLEKINVAQANRHYISKDGILFTKDAKELVVYPMGRQGKKYSLPQETKRIRYHAFQSSVYLEEIVLNDGLVYIGSYAFTDSKIKSMVLPDSVSGMGEGAFMDCKLLTEVKLSQKLLEILPKTFQGCVEMKAIDIPKEVAQISDIAFLDCVNLEKITVSPENTTYTSQDGVLYSKSLQTLLLYPAAKKETIFTVPTNVISVNFGAFRDLQYTRTVEFTYQVTKVGVKTFSNARSIEKVVLPKWIKEIPDEMFLGCKNLKEVNIPDSVNEICSNAFEGCSSLKSISLGSGIKEIGYHAFERCTSLKSIKLEGAVKIVRMGAFLDCKHLQSITLGKKVSAIWDSTFENCVSLKKLVVKSTKINNNSFKGPNVFKKAGGKAPSKLVVTVPKGKKKAYQKYFRKAGLSKKAKFR